MITRSPIDLLLFTHIKTKYFILTSQFNYGEVGTSFKTQDPKILKLASQDC